jgi:hypothetical protein
MPSSSIRIALAVCMFACITGAAWAGHGKALGSVAQANNALVDNGTAMAGATVFACDVLDTDNYGDLRVNFRNSEIVLGTSSEVVLDGSPDAVRVIVVSGSTSSSSPSAAALVIETPAGTLREASGQAYTGIVTIVGSNELMVSAVRGSITLGAGGAAHTIPAGKSARVTFDHAANPGCREPGYARNSASSRNVKVHIIGVAMVAGGGTVAWHELTESETKPDEF